MLKDNLDYLRSSKYIHCVDVFSPLLTAYMFRNRPLLITHLFYQAKEVNPYPVIDLHKETSQQQRAKSEKREANSEKRTANSEKQTSNPVTVDQNKQTGLVGLNKKPTLFDLILSD
ncbi:MAG: hypothetical protein RIG77_06445 [Cyclobacteriaceae bacterium]